MDIELINAAAVGDHQTLQRCLEQGANINAEDVRGETALMKAAFGGHVLSLNYLLIPRNIVLELDHRGGLRMETALMKACRIGHDECARYLITAGARLDIEDNRHSTALLRAVENNHTRCIELLVHHGVNIHATNRQGCTALMSAAHRGNDEVVDLLLNAGSVVDVKDNNLDQTALMKAASEGHDECVRLLLKFCANVFITDRAGTSALVKATRDWCFIVEIDEERKRRDFQCVTQLCDKGAEVNTVDSRGETILMKASAMNFLECVDYLLGRGANVNSLNDSGQTALMMAVKHGHPQICKSLLENGAIANEANLSGETVLMQACMTDSTDPDFLNNTLVCVKALLEYDADPDVVDHDRWTPLMHVTAKGWLDCVMMMVEKGADVNMQDRDGFTALERARQLQRGDIVQFLENHRYL